MASDHTLMLALIAAAIALPVLMFWASLVLS